jgi:hypothetical protein
MSRRKQERDGKRWKEMERDGKRTDRNEWGMICISVSISVSSAKVAKCCQGLDTLAVHPLRCDPLSGNLRKIKEDAEDYITTDEVYSDSM